MASGKNMPVKFIGRKSFDRGNTLFWYAAHLKDLGVGRTFVLTKELDTYPEKCYYKPTRVAPDFSDPSNLRRGQIWAEQVYRGKSLGEVLLKNGHKKDWKIIPKEEEQDFCRIGDIYEEIKLVPKLVPFPPLMGVLLKKQNKLSREPLLKIDLPKDAEGIDYAEYIESRKRIRDKKNEISPSLDS